MDRKHIDGPKLARLRDAAGLTQVQLAVAAGVDTSAVTRIERGVVRNPAVSTIRSLARVLGVTIDDLLTEPEPAPAAEAVGG